MDIERGCPDRKADREEMQSTPDDGARRLYDLLMGVARGRERSDERVRNNWRR
jgi:hypothetical protein